MRVAVLSSVDDQPVGAAVRCMMARRGAEVRFHDLAHERFAPCQGCFECWVAHPGTCKANDHANEVMRDIVASDGVVWLVKTRFGAWDPVAKAALDKTIGIISPFFTTVGGETHHRKRYKRYPRWAVLALSYSDDTDAERDRFRTLVARNVLNMRSHSPFVAFADDLAPREFATMTDQALTHLSAHHPEDDVPLIDPLPPLGNAVGPATSDRRAVLWVGSAKPAGTSTSEALGTALLRRLEASGWECRTLHAAKVTKLGRAGSPELVAAARTASVLIVASPVYIDCLPALVLKGLAEVVDGVHDGDAPAVLPIVQCGFPEATHTRLAVELVACAASQAGIPWAGHLALGGGGFINGSEIDSAPRYRRLRAALDRVAEALVAGHHVPPDLTTSLSAPFVNPTVYRWLGNMGWLTGSVRRGSLTGLWQRPFVGPESSVTEYVSG